MSNRRLSARLSVGGGINTPEKSPMRKVITEDETEAITVICRFRPFKQIPHDSQNFATEQVEMLEKQKIFVFPPAPPKSEENGEEASAPPLKSVTVQLDSYGTKDYVFDRIHDMNARQEDIFTGGSGRGAEEVIDAVMNGYNGAILAYGQTSAGKTHTMEGPSLRSSLTASGDLAESAGVIPRSVDKIFRSIKKRMELQQDTCPPGCPPATLSEYTIVVSYFEIYCEKLRDLLNPAHDNMKLRETVVAGAKGVSTFTVQDVTEVTCKTVGEVYDVLETGKVYRASAPTLMNAESSRSHSILLLRIQQHQKYHSHPGDPALDKVNTVSTQTSRLYLVDLAGSEKVGKTGATGDRLKEAQMINKSLTTFGMVINALSTPGGAGHVPYRDSKLTMVLSDSIGGNSKTTLIICCSPDVAQINESLSTLRFGERAKKIEKVVSNNDANMLSQLFTEYYLTCTHSDLRNLFVLCRKELELARSSSAVTADRPETGDSGKPEAKTGESAASADGLEGNSLASSDSCDIINYKQLYTEMKLSSEENALKLVNLEDENAKLSFEIVELKSDIEGERVATITSNNKVNSLHVDIQMLQHTVKELEENLFKAKTAHLSSPFMMKEGTGAEVTGEEFSALGEKYLELKDDYKVKLEEAQLKLSHEQVMRVDLENKYFAAMERIQQLEETAIIRASEKNSTPKKSLSSWALGVASAMGGFSNSTSSTTSTINASGALQQLYQAQSKQLQTLSKQLETTQLELRSREADLEMQKEQQQILIDLKDDVLRSILQNSSTVTEERDAYAERVNELTSTVEQLTLLLRTTLQKHNSSVMDLDDHYESEIESADVMSEEG